MSIAILKRKTLNGNPRLSPISGKTPLGFALNGTRRIKGVVGPTNLGANKVPSLGSHQYCCTINSNDFIKPSVKNTKGMISSRYLGLLHRGYPTENTTKEQSEFITKVHVLNLCVNPENKPSNIKICSCPERKYTNKIVYTKRGIGAIDQGSYISRLYKNEIC